MIRRITDADDAFNTINSANNYGYDKIGRRIRDDQGEMESIAWTVSSKLKAVTRPITSTKKNLYYAYDASGNRIMKQVGDPDMDVEDYREHYVRDALGNIMAVYRYTNSSSASLKQSERSNIHDESAIGTSIYRSRRILKATRIFGADTFRNQACGSASGTAIPPGNRSGSLAGRAARRFSFA
ncbi:MAG: hypothetical protein IPJ85_04175 [Flavobacteriales bacterium]|nr:hypothetical protein [Flavobacteriales bacterium]